jgi:2-polyprenyl-3-methyl-5-hydroxy-6-metoxy-1,4-benzoquinol methylase
MGDDWEYVGVDIDPDLVGPAQRLFPQAHFRVLNLEDRDCPDLGKFDCIVAAAVVEHLENPKRVLKELCRHLRDGGRLIITTPSPRGRLFLFTGATIGLLNPKVTEAHKSLLSAEDLCELLHECGLQLQICRTFMFGLNQLLVAEKTS